MCENGAVADASYLFNYVKKFSGDSMLVVSISYYTIIQQSYVQADDCKQLLAIKHIDVRIFCLYPSKS